MKVCAVSTSALSQAGLPYRIIGGMAVFYHVSERDHDKARFSDTWTPLSGGKISTALSPRRSPWAFGTGMWRKSSAQPARWCCARKSDDMLLDPVSPGARSALHLVFANERFRPGDFEAIRFSEPYLTTEGMHLAPIADVIRMKLASFRLKDKVRWADHVRD